MTASETMQLASIISANVLVVGGVILRVEIALANLKTRMTIQEKEFKIHEEKNRSDINKLFDKIDKNHNEIKNILINKSA